MRKNFRNRPNFLARVIRLCAVTCCLLALHIDLSAAQQDPVVVESEAESAAEISRPQPWEPPAPPADEFDWIQLNSGEWLKGELKVLYEEKLEFDSDKLGLLKLNWEDVKQVRGHRVFSIRFEGPVTAEGLLQITEDKVFVTVGDDRQEFARIQLVAIAQRAPREIDYWSAKISVGFNSARGNTKQTQWSTIANIIRRTSSTRFTADWLGNFSETDGEQTVNNQRFSAFFDVFRTRKYFFRPVFGEYFRDPFSNISSRVTVGTAVGYHIIDTAKTEWDVSGGPAYQQTRFDSVPVGQNEKESTPALVAGTRFNTELTRAIDFNFQYNFQIVKKESGTYTHHLVTAFSTALTGWLDFDVSFVWDRIQDPQTNADGTVPKQNDYFFIIGLGIDI